MKSNAFEDNISPRPEAVRQTYQSINSEPCLRSSIIKHFERESGNLFPLYFCVYAAEVCNFSSLHTFLTFTCATHQNCTNIKQFSPPNNKFLRKTINFYKVLIKSEGKSETFYRMEAKWNQNWRFFLYFSSPLGLLFS